MAEVVGLGFNLHYHNKYKGRKKEIKNLSIVSLATCWQENLGFEFLRSKWIWCPPSRMNIRPPEIQH
jgi:hypothetical protein